MPYSDVDELIYFWIYICWRYPIFCQELGRLKFVLLQRSVIQFVLLGCDLFIFGLFGSVLFKFVLS